MRNFILFWMCGIGGSAFLFLNNTFDNEPSLAFFYAMMVLLIRFAFNRLKQINQVQTARQRVQPERQKFGK